MEETTEIKKDAVLTRLMQPDTATRLPEQFNDKMMERIQARVKRKACIISSLQYLFTTITSLGLIFGTVSLLAHYSSFNILDELSQIFKKVRIEGDLSLYPLIGGIVLLLLYLDHILRRRYESRQKEDTFQNN